MTAGFHNSNGCVLRSLWTRWARRTAYAVIAALCPLLFSQPDSTPSASEGSAIRNHVTVGDATLGYVSLGQGLDCLVIGSSVYYPRTFPTRLGDDLRLHFVDMRWFAPEPGDLAPRELTVELIVEDIESVRQRLGLSQLVVIGHSIHGAVAMEYARRHPERVKAAVVIGTPCLLGSGEYERIVGKAWERASTERRRLQERNWRELSQRGEMTPSERIVEDYCAMAPKYWYDPTYDGRWLWSGMTIHAELMHRLYGELFSNYRMFEEGDAAPVPTLAVLGRYDFVAPPELWEAFVDVPQLDIVVLEKSGHTPQLEQGDRFSDLLVDWLNSKEAFDQ